MPQSLEMDICAIHKSIETAFICPEAGPLKYLGLKLKMGLKIESDQNLVKSV